MYTYLDSKSNLFTVTCPCCGYLNKFNLVHKDVCCHFQKWHFSVDKNFKRSKHIAFVLFLDNILKSKLR